MKDEYYCLGAIGLTACAAGTFSGVYFGTGNLAAAIGGASGLLFAAIGVLSYSQNRNSTTLPTS